MSLRRWRDRFDITLPAGYVVDETPDPVDVDMDFASYHVAVTVKGNVLHYEREYVVRQCSSPRTEQPTSASSKARFSSMKRAPLYSRNSSLARLRHTASKCF